MALETKRDHDVITLLAETTSIAGPLNVQCSSVRLPGMVNAMVFVLDVSAAATDNADTLDVSVQTVLDGTNWIDVAHFTQVLGDGGPLTYINKIVAGVAQAEFETGTALGAAAVRNLFGDEWRVNYVQADADADATFTFSVTAIPM